MGIARDNPAAVDNLHRQPIAPNGSRKSHSARTGCVDLGADRRCEINSVMHPDTAQVFKPGRDINQRGGSDIGAPGEAEEHHYRLSGPIGGADNPSQVIGQLPGHGYDRCGQG